MDYTTLRVEAAPGTELADGIRTLVLNRPEVMNAMNTQMFVDLRNALHELAFDDGQFVQGVAQVDEHLRVHRVHHLGAVEHQGADAISKLGAGRGFNA
jgi:hypothetical protein